MIDIDRQPSWRAEKKMLSVSAYKRYDVVLQVVGEQVGLAPYDDLFAAVSKKRRLPTLAAASDNPVMVTLPTGTTVCRLPWFVDADTFSRLQALRQALVALLALSPRMMALDIRAAGAATDVLYAALIAAARLPGDARSAVSITVATTQQSTLIATSQRAEANTLARTLIQLPPNDLSPPVFVRLARQLANQHGLGVTVYTAKQLARMGAGAIIAVGRGSVDNQPAIVHLRTQPQSKKRVALVGKGICFDTGGVNVKSARYMRGMSKDMAGAATVLAAIVAASQRRLPIGIDAWLALAENAIGPTAYRPDEVITAYNGKRIEIVHTDAEGRLVLADTLTLASQKKPAALISFATLTGSMHAALGERMSGFFASDSDWQQRALAAATDSGERLCYFPMPEDYRQGLKSDVADIKQCANEGEADHILAALFLREFIVGKPAWLHVDLSSASCQGGLAAAPGPITGFGVAWVLSLLQAYC